MLHPDAYYTNNHAIASNMCSFFMSLWQVHPTNGSKHQMFWANVHSSKVLPSNGHYTDYDTIRYVHNNTNRDSDIYNHTFAENMCLVCLSTRQDHQGLADFYCMSRSPVQLTTMLLSVTDNTDNHATCDIHNYTMGNFHNHTTHHVHHNTFGKNLRLLYVPSQPGSQVPIRFYCVCGAECETSVQLKCLLFAFDDDAHHDPTGNCHHTTATTRRPMQWGASIDSSLFRQEELLGEKGCQCEGLISVDVWCLWDVGISRCFCFGGG